MTFASRWQARLPVAVGGAVLAADIAFILGLSGVLLGSVLGLLGALVAALALVLLAAHLRRAPSAPAADRVLGCGGAATA